MATMVKGLMGHEITAEWSALSSRKPHCDHRVPCGENDMEVTID